MNAIERLEQLLAQPKGMAEGHVLVMPGEVVWECGACGFTFLADHTDDGTGRYSCPGCFELAVKSALPDLLKLARAVYVVHVETNPCTDMRCPICIAALPLWSQP